MKLPTFKHTARGNLARSTSMFALATAVSIATPALAQDAAPAPSDEQEQARGVEEIVVTARRVEEDLQTVPVTVTAFTERALETRGITNTVELGSFVPNTQFDTTSQFSGAATTFQAFIRGIGQADFAINTDPGVGVYVDDVYIARTLGAVFDLYDIEQVEVLKGPQGTLFGRNAIGGAINIRTARPSNEFTGRGSVSYGRFNTINLDAAVNLPISDYAAASLAVSSETADGFQIRRIPDVPGIGNLIGGELNTASAANGGDQGRLDNQAVRGKLRWEVSESIETTFSADYSRARDSATAQTVVALIGSQEAAAVGTDPLGLNPNSLASLFNGCVLGLAPPPVCATTAEFGRPFFNLNGDADPTNDIPLFGANVIATDIDESFATGANFSNFDVWGVSNVTEIDLSDNFSLKSIIAYRELEAAFGTDLDGSPLPVNNPTFTIDQNQFSAELQLNGSLLDDRLGFTVGGFYFDEEAVQADNVLIGSVLQIGGDNAQDTRAFALFGEANFAITDRLKFLFGLRYTDERKELQLDQRSETNFFGVVLAAPFPSGFLEDGDGDSVFPRTNPDGTPNVNFLGPTAPQIANFDDLSFRAGLNYEISDDLFAFFTFSQGFKSGGFTTRLTAPFNPAFNPDAALIGAGIPPGLSTIIFQPETSDNYEIGLKADLFDGLARANFSTFWNEYQDIQIIVTRGISPANENAGDGRIRGAELELEVYPTSQLSIVASAGYIDAEYTDVDPLAAPVNENSAFQNTPEWTLSAAANYTLPVFGGRGDLTFNGNISYRSEVANDAQNTPELIQSENAILGAHVRYEDASNGWAFSVIGRNLTDQRVIDGGFNAGTGASIVTASFNRPREWAVQLDFEF